MEPNLKNQKITAEQLPKIRAENNFLVGMQALVFDKKSGSEDTVMLQSIEGNLSDD